MIAEAAPIAEDPSTKKESRAKSAAPYLLSRPLPENQTPDNALPLYTLRQSPRY
jgi:hypothetical protein